MLKTLKDIYKLSDKIFLFYGTLLGAIREKDFIEWDKDIDVGILYEDLPELDLKDFEVLRKTIGEKMFNSRLCKYRLQGKGSKVCFDVFHQMGDDLAVTEDNKFLKIYPKDLILPLKQITFQGIKVNIPNQPEKILEHLYGDWRTPQGKDFKWFNSPQMKERLKQRNIIESKCVWRVSL